MVLPIVKISIYNLSTLFIFLIYLQHKIKGYLIDQKWRGKHMSYIINRLFKNVYLQILKILQIPQFHNAFLFQLAKTGHTLKGKDFSVLKHDQFSKSWLSDKDDYCISLMGKGEGYRRFISPQSNYVEPESYHLSWLKDDTHCQPRETATQMLLSRSINHVFFFIFFLSKK